MHAFQQLSSIFSTNGTRLLQDNPFAKFTIAENLVQYPAFCEAVKYIADLHQRGLHAKSALGLLITAQSGSGKTTLLKFYKSHFPKQELAERTISPVLLVTTPDFPTVKSLAEAILIELGDPAAGRGTTEEKTRRIVRYLKECKVELLLIDEFQHFYDSRLVTQARKVTDWLKNLFNLAGIPVVLCGLPRSVMVLRLNPQLKRRFSSPFYLKPFGFETGSDQREFRGVLKAIQGKLPLPCPDLHEAELARRFYFATQGLFDYLTKIIDQAVLTAGEQGDEALDMAHFFNAFVNAVWRDAPLALNPFSDKPVLRPLTRTGEPFELWDDPAQYVSRKVAN